MRGELSNVECIQCGSVFPTKYSRQKRCDDCKEDNRSVRAENYLSKRERFAAMALQGLCVPCIPGTHNGNDAGESQDKAKMAVRLADALLAELAKTEGK